MNEAFEGRFYLDLNRNGLYDSNGFLPVGDPVPPGSLPNLTAAPGYEVQIFRWTFRPSATGGCGP